MRWLPTGQPQRRSCTRVYFFALRVHAWVEAGILKKRRTRLLNDTFGHSFVATLLDHRIVALRLRKGGEPEAYFATYYGLFDPEYTKLVRRLTSDIMSRRRHLSDGVTTPLAKKQQAIDEQLALLLPEPSRMLATLEDGET